MKKILFVLAMLLMSMTSTLAEESSETFDLTSDENWFGFTLDSEHFTVSGEAMLAPPPYVGAYIDRDYRIYINAINDEIITRVEFSLYGDGEARGKSGDDKYIPVSEGEYYVMSDVNKSYLEIYGFNVGYDGLVVPKITIYYESGDNGNNNGGDNGGGNGNNNTFVMDEYVQTESFSINGEPTYSGRKITITGTGNGDGFHIAGGNSVNITAKSYVKIVKVDFGLGVRNNESPINSYPGVVEGSDKNWTINNINSSSLTISNPGEGKVQINSIKVYYVEMSTEKTEFFDVEQVNSCSGYSVTMNGTEKYKCAMELANGNSVTITANTGVEITKLDVHFILYRYDGVANYKPIDSTVGDVVMYGESNDRSCYVNDVNSSSLTLSHPGVGEGYEVQIKEITVYYKEKVPPTTIDVAAKAAGDGYWATFYSDACDYIAPEGTQVFKVNLNGTSIIMTEIQDRVVTKGQGVVLKSSTGNISMTKTSYGSDCDYSGNSLRGTSVSITNPGNAYVLSSSSTKGVGFYKLSSNGTIGINKAYLVYDGSTDGARSFFAFDDVTTGIEMNNVDNNKGNDKVYDLQGRRVTKPTNGIYIVNGKKVIMNRR